MTKHIALAAAGAAHAADITDLPVLSTLEWKVVSLALREVSERPCATRMPRTAVGRLAARWWKALTGAEAVRPLADPRLEALRRFVCAVRSDPRRGEALAPMLGEAGFNERQIAAVALLSAR